MTIMFFVFTSFLAFFALLFWQAGKLNEEIGRRS